MNLWAIVLLIHQQVSEIQSDLKAIRLEQVAQRAILDAILTAVTPAPAASLVLKLGVPTQQT
jgi:hypothetical protein